MFEKEAEEYADVPFFSPKTDSELMALCFKDGAEFGYNKAKEEGKVVVEHFEAYGQCRDSRRIADLEAKNATLELKIKKITQHLEPQTMTALFEQVEEEAKQEELLNSTLDENKDIYKKMADLDTALEDCTESLTDARIKIKELEKENAELKTRVKNQKSFLERIRAKFNLGKLERKEIEGYLTNEQLSAAKEIIRTLISCLINWVQEGDKDYCYITDAEQFLKESE